MRTTLNLDPDVLEAARRMASEQGRTLGAIVSDLARRGLQAPERIRYEGDFPVFDVGEGAPPLTALTVAEASDEQP